MNDLVNCIRTERFAHTRSDESSNGIKREELLVEKLECNAVNCLYNYSTVCSADEIKVQGEQAMGSDATFCGTFSSKSVGNYVSSIGNMNYDGAAKQVLNHTTMEPHVLCDAVNCTYNANKICNADAVQILNDVSTTAEQTECQTFYPR